MATSNVIDTPAPQTRPRCSSALLAELEQRCARMWSVEPSCSIEQRTVALESLMSVEHRLSSLALRETVTGRVLDRRFGVELGSCQLELDLIADHWDLSTIDAEAA